MKPHLDRRDGWFLAALLACALPIYAWHLNRPFVYHWNMHGPVFSLPASNYLKFGVYPLGTSGDSLDEYEDYRRHFYINHPPLPGLLTTLAFKIFGEREAAYRGTMVLMSCIAVGFFLALSRSLLPREGAWIATGLFALMPLFAYYGPLVGHMSVMLPCVMIMMVGYRSWTATTRPSWLVVMAAAQLLACASAWEGYYAAAAVAAHALWTRRDWKLASAVVALNFAAFGGFLGWLHALSPPDPSLVDQFFGLGAQRAGGDPILTQATAVGWELAKYVTAPVLLAALLGTVSWWKHRRAETSAFIVCWLAFGADQVVFRHYSVVHDFFTLPVAPFFAWLAALAAVELWRRWSFGPVLVALLGLAFVAQTARVMHSALRNDFGPDAMRTEISLLVRAHTEPGSRVLLITRPPIFHYAWYSGRTVEIYDPVDRTLEQSYSEPPAKVDYGRMIEIVRTRERAYDYVMVPRLDLLLADNPRFTGQPDLARWWHALEPDSEEYRALESMGAVESHRGFVFIRLR